MKILEVRGLVKHYGSGEGLVRAVDGIHLSVEKGEFLAVIGTSGSGKTTMLNAIGGLDKPDSGEIRINGQNISDMKPDELTVLAGGKSVLFFRTITLYPS